MREITDIPDTTEDEIVWTDLYAEEEKPVIPYRDRFDPTGRFEKDRVTFLCGLYPEGNWGVGGKEEKRDVVQSTCELLEKKRDLLKDSGGERTAEVDYIDHICSILNYPLIKYFLNRFGVYAVYPSSDCDDFLSPLLEVSQNAFKRVRPSEYEGYLTYIGEYIKGLLLNTRDSIHYGVRIPRNRMWRAKYNYILTAEKWSSDFRTLSSEEKILYYFFSDKFWKYEEERNKGNTVEIKDFLSDEEKKMYSERLSDYGMIEMYMDILENDNTGIELIPLEKLERSLFFDFERRMFKKYLDHLLEGIDERDKGFFFLYYGLLDGEKRTYQEIGERFYYTKEGIRQIVDGVLRKLRRRIIVNEGCEQVDKSFKERIGIMDRLS